MALKYRNGGSTFSVYSNYGIESRLYDKRITMRNSANVAEYALFERDNAPESAGCCEAVGNRLKIAVGSPLIIYRSLKVPTRSVNPAVSYPFVTVAEDLDSAVYADWTEIFSSTANIDVDRRGLWDRGTFIGKNIALHVYSTILLAGNTLEIKWTFTYLLASGASETITLSGFNAAWPAAIDEERSTLVYPFAATAVSYKIYAKGGLGANNSFGILALKH